MEFGIFNAVCLTPKFRAEHGAKAEHRRIMDELAYIRAADTAGFKYSWASEHHFLTEYSHLSANESFLAFAAAQTKNIHLGSGIFNLTPPVNRDDYLLYKRTRHIMHEQRVRAAIAAAHCSISTVSLVETMRRRVAR